MTLIETKAAACAEIAVRHGLRTTIPWLSILTALLSLLATCLPLIAGRTPHDVLSNPTSVDKLAMRRVCREHGCTNHDEATKAATVLMEVGRGTTAAEAAVLMTEAAA